MPELLSLKSCGANASNKRSSFVDHGPALAIAQNHFRDEEQELQALQYSSAFLGMVLSGFTAAMEKRGD